MSMQEIERNLDRFIRRTQNLAGEAVTDIGLDFLGKSSRRAPVLHGFLRGSGYLATEDADLAETDANGNVMQVGAQRQWGDTPTVEAGWGEVYAAVQHERTDFKHPRGGEAKFAEKTLHENEGRYREHVFNKSRI